MSEQLPSRMSVELSLAGAEPVEVYDRAIGNYDTIFRQAEAMALFAQLPPVLRGFLTSLSADRLDADTILVFADWLEENGQTAEGQRVRLLRPQPGDVLAVWCGTSLARRRQDDLRGLALPPSVAVVALYDDERIEAIDPEQLRAAGWVRESEAEERVRAEREEIARLVETGWGWRTTERLAEAIRHRGE